MDLTTSYLGLTLPHPIIASASPLSRTAEGVHELEAAGAAAIVLPSLFAEQIGAESNGETGSAWPGAEAAEMLFPGWSREPLGTQEYLDLIALARRHTRVPLIASLNADTTGEWTRYARRLRAAGADALELSLYAVNADPTVTAYQTEQRYLEIVRAVRRETDLPLAVKIGPFFSSLPHFAQELKTAGADALVLFHRYYAPDFDPETRTTTKHDVVLSQSRQDLRLPLRWTATLTSVLGNQTPIALTGGVHTGIDAVKAVMAGAAVVEVASELLRNGRHRLAGIRDELAAWLRSHDYASCDAIRGVLRDSALANSCLPAGQAERAGYIDTIRSHSAGEPHP